MTKVKYIRLDPTGNLTCLVLDPVSREDRPRVTAALMDRCEQVGYLTRAADPGARARLEMMGGEFCGNASMATAVYLAETDGVKNGQRSEMLLEVSGAEKPVRCGAQRTADGWRGTAEMPLPLEIKEITLRARKLTAVRLPGMVHLIHEGTLEKAEAEALLKEARARITEPAAGLLQWQEERQRMTPLVWVRDSDTLVWETSCGSGTEAIACWKALRAGKGLKLRITQPGGALEAAAELTDGAVTEVRLSGRVGLESPSVIEIR